MVPLVTIIITLFNRERFVAQAIRSVLTQTHPNLQIIICDDGSTDASREVAAQAIAGDSRATLVALTHAGINPTLAHAHTLAQGDFVGWVDSDDLLHPQAVEACLAAMAARGATPGQRAPGIVYTHHDIINERGESQGLGQRCTIPYSPQRLLVDFMTFHFRLLRRSVFEQAGGINTSMALAQDYDLCLRMSEVAPIVCLPKVLYSYRAAQDSVSNAKRLEQIEASAGAVRRALQRRGLADKAELQVDIVARFSIRPKGSGGWSQA